jgi:hypothetical protein
MSQSAEVIAEIRRLYYATSKQTIARDMDRAIDLLKQLPSDEERERAAVFMDGLAQMRAEWRVGRTAGAAAPPRRRQR